MILWLFMKSSGRGSMTAGASWASQKFVASVDVKSREVLDGSFEVLTCLFEAETFHHRVSSHRRSRRCAECRNVGPGIHSV